MTAETKQDLLHLLFDCVYIHQNKIPYSISQISVFAWLLLSVRGCSNIRIFFGKRYSEKLTVETK